MGRTITTAAIKGGVGKTATAGALAFAAAHQGKRVLVIDLDPQSNLSIWMNADLYKPGSYDLLTDSADITSVIQATASGIDIISGSPNLTIIHTSPGSARRLEAALQAVKRRYDLILIDTAPSMGELQNNALYASNGIIIPLCSDGLSLQGLYKTADIVNHVRVSKPSLRFLGVVLTQYDSRAKFNQFTRGKIQETAEALNIPYLMEIRQGIAVKEAIGLQVDLFSYAPKSKPAQDYMQLYKLLFKGA